MMELLGELRPDKDVPEWLVSQPVEVPYFPGVRIAFVIEDLAEDRSPHEFTAAVRRFLDLTLVDRDQTASHVFKNYTDFVEAVGPENVDVVVSQPKEVWARVHPTAIHVSRRHRRDQKVYVQITAECDWEPEHGLQIVYREGNQLSRVSSQDGHLTHTDAYDLAEDEDRIS
jgi:hypothetical protein